MSVCLFDEAGTETPHVLTEQTLGIWHGALPDVPVGTTYGYRVDGPWDPAQGLRFNRHKLLLDPYGLAVSGRVTDDPAIFGYVLGSPELMSEVDSAPYVPRSVVVDPAFDWGDERPMFKRWRDSVIFAVHV
jgi:pullulanase/glycogen debranching enzyme